MDLRDIVTQIDGDRRPPGAGAGIGELIDSQCASPRVGAEQPPEYPHLTAGSDTPQVLSEQGRHRARVGQVEE